MLREIILSSSRFSTFPALRIICQIGGLDFRPVQQMLTRVAAMKAQILGRRREQQVLTRVAAMNAQFLGRRREQISAKLRKYCFWSKLPGL